MALPARIDLEYWSDGVLEYWSIGKTIKGSEFSGTGFVYYLHR
jgi:hypothetical protein